MSVRERGMLNAGDARVLEGHAFVVEAAVSVGGRDIKPGINIYRFANRIPLLFEVVLIPMCSADCTY
jgi:DNA topoisomerase VI subunit B